LSGTKVRKMHTSRRDAFRTMNGEQLAVVLPDGKIEVTDEQYPKRSKSKTSLRGMDSNVELVYAYPDMDPGIIDYYVKKKVKALVIAATAMGHVPLNSSKSLGPALQKAVNAKIPIFITTQTLYGRVHPYVYANLRKLSVGLGITFLQDMLPEVAYVKAMVAVKQKDTVQFMKTTIAGEMSDREIDDNFLI